LFDVDVTDPALEDVHFDLAHKVPRDFASEMVQQGLNPQWDHGSTEMEKGRGKAPRWIMQTS